MECILWVSRSRTSTERWRDLHSIACHPIYSGAAHGSDWIAVGRVRTVRRDRAQDQTHYNHSSCKIHIRQACSLRCHGRFRLATVSRTEANTVGLSRSGSSVRSITGAYRALIELLRFARQGVITLLEMWRNAYCIQSWCDCSSRNVTKSLDLKPPNTLIELRCCRRKLIFPET